MDIAKMTTIHEIQNPRGNRRSKVTMKRRHRARFDASLIARSHDEFRAFPEFLNERRDLTKVVSAIAVAHDHIFAADIIQGIDVGAAQASLGSLENPRPLFERDIRGP